MLTRKHQRMAAQLERDYGGSPMGEPLAPASPSPERLPVMTERHVAALALLDAHSLFPEADAPVWEVIANAAAQASRKYVLVEREEIEAMRVWVAETTGNDWQQNEALDVIDNRWLAR